LIRLKNVLILYPHWVPSNLTGVHRVRLVANALLRKGYRVTLITVHEDHYEDRLDTSLQQLVEEGLIVKKVSAFPVQRIRFFGDLGLRGFLPLLRELKKAIAAENFHVLWTPIPSFYCGLIPLLIPKGKRPSWGVDYIDPWVRRTKGRGMREWLSVQVAKILEPFVVKSVDWVSGVNRSYYQPALERNNRLNLPSASFPYGLDPLDFSVNHSTNVAIGKGGLQGEYALYAGAFLPDSTELFRSFFSALRDLQERNELPVKHFVFIGTGSNEQRNVKTIAEACGVGNLVEEYSERFGYLDTIALQKKAALNFVIGSAESHYTPSKVFQNFMAGNPVFLMTHFQSPVWEDLSSWSGYHQFKWGKSTMDKLEKELKKWLSKEGQIAGPVEGIQIDQVVSPLLTLWI